MKIADLKPRMGNVDITITIQELGEIREFQKFGKTGRVCTATVSDDSGETKLTLWNEDIDKIKPGSKIKIINGYVSEFQGEMQLTAGRFGKLEILGEGPEESKESKEDEKMSEEEQEKEEEKEPEAEATDEEEKKDTEEEKPEAEATDEEEKKDTEEEKPEAEATE